MDHCNRWCPLKFSDFRLGKSQPFAGFRIEPHAVGGLLDHRADEPQVNARVAAMRDFLRVIFMVLLIQVV
jgi:hypothetical protein